MTKDTLISGKSLDYNGKSLSFSAPKIMGILNVTPDSFYDGGKNSSVGSVLNLVDEMLNEGVDILDIGGYSTRPRATDISSDEELKRVLPYVKAIRKAFPECWLSLDTFRSEIAAACISEGVDMINDVSGGSLDTEMFHLIAKHNIPYVLMHMRGTPQTMGQLNHYEDITKEVIDEISKVLQLLKGMGNTQVIIDPGFGFAKVGSQNFELMKDLTSFTALEQPILVGISRKSMIYKLLGTEPDKALNGTTVLNTFALMNGANILRVHDVKEAAEAIKITALLK